mgnify:CR=1 FL=1|jgi:hypothetical protein
MVESAPAGINGVYVSSVTVLYKYLRRYRYLRMISSVDESSVDENNVGVAI